MTEANFLRETRTFYDTLAVDYANRYRGYLDTRPLDRSVLAGFAELVRGAGPVADVGCGPGWTTAHLVESGLDVFGLDLSPEMVGLARQAYPALRFDVGSMLTLDLPDGALGGVNAWYSIIHLPEEQLPAAFAEFHRVLAPGGHLQLAFQVGDEPLHLAQPYGHPVSLDFRRLQPDRIAELLAAADLPLRVRMVREPDDGESTQQAFLLARKPLDS
ncbi:SAM-dependent methyltransferase [Streptomyces griseocarneus]|nr:SAM-dependent methyltransferase [Streptomyces griseocarneus]